MTYEPQPGTIPHRAYKHLKERRELNEPTDINTVDLCAALGIDTHGFAAYMQPLRMHGLVHTSKRPRTHGKMLFWRLGDGTRDPLLMNPFLGDLQPEKAEREEAARVEQIGAEPVEPAEPQAGEVFPGVSVQEFRALMWEGQLLTTGMEIRDGVAIYTADQIDQVKRVVTWVTRGAAA